MSSIHVLPNSLPVTAMDRRISPIIASFSLNYCSRLIFSRTVEHKKRPYIWVRERERDREGEHRLALSVGTMFCFLFLFFVMEFVTEVIGAQQRLMQQRLMCMFYLFNLYHPLCLKDMLAWTCAAHRHTHMWGKRDEQTNWITATKSLMLLYELFASPPPPPPPPPPSFTLCTCALSL